MPKKSETETETSRLQRRNLINWGIAQVQPHCRLPGVIVTIRSDNFIAFHSINMSCSCSLVLKTGLVSLLGLWPKRLQTDNQEAETGKSPASLQEILAEPSNGEIGRKSTICTSTKPDRRRPRESFQAIC